MVSNGASTCRRVNFALHKTSFYYGIFFLQKGASVAEMLSVLGKPEALHRLHAALQRVGHGETDR